tara:strand:+ start:343 stop:759 length:417 start_codon:yes stop_codon:yes gene_type:complete
MILVIRISGQVEIPPKAQEAMYRLNLRKKYTATLVKSTKENIANLNKVRNFIAFGEINKETLLALIEKRAQNTTKKKIDSPSVVEQLEKKSLRDLGLKPFFRLHPPRGGINSKLHFPIKKGVLGNNKEKINDLVRRML